MRFSTEHAFCRAANRGKKGCRLGATPAFRHSLLPSSAIQVLACLALLPLLSVRAAAAPVQDYSKGFERLYELGLPSATGATYVALSGSGSPASSPHGLKGNAWLLREEDGKGAFIVGQKEVAEYSRHAPNPRERRTWRPADLDADIQTLLQSLEKRKLSSSSTGLDPFSISYHSRGNDNPSTADLFFCAHLHAVGKQAEARRIASMLLADADAAAATLGAALNLLAGAQYEAALTSFSSTGDWTALHDAVAMIRATFGARWELDRGVAILAEKLEARLQGVPEIQGEHLTAEHHALARQLAEQPWEEDTVRPSIWLLSPPAAPEQAETLGFAANILRGGVETLPLWTALLGDDTLIRNTQGKASYDDHFRWMGRQREGEIGEAMYLAMPRPRTRGELAREVLERVLPAKGDDDDGVGEDGAGEDGEAEPATAFRKQAESLYAQLRGKDDAGIVQFYLSHERPAARRQIISALINRSKLDRYATEIEAALLELEASSLHESYLAQRGDAARPFAERLLVRSRERLAVLEQPAPEPAPAENGHEPLFKAPEQDWRTQHRLSSLKSAIEGIEDFLSDKTLDERLKALLEEGKTSYNASYTLYQRIARHPLQETVPAFLRAAIAAPTSKQAAEMLGHLMKLAGWIRYIQREQTASTPPPTYLPAPDRALWEALLADTRNALYGGDRASWAGSIAYRAALALDQILRTDEDERAVEGLERLPAIRVERLKLARAQALVAGKAVDDLPPLVAEPAPDLAKELAVRLTSVADDALSTFLEGLTDVEYLALVRHAADDDAVRSRFAPLSRRVRTVSEVPEGFPASVGATLTVETVRAVAEWAKAAARDGQSLSIFLLRGTAAADGFTVTVGELSQAYGRHHRGSGSTGSRSIARIEAIIVMAERLRAQNEWGVPKEEPPVVTDAPTTDDGDEELAKIADDSFGGDERRSGDFWKAVETILTDKDLDPFSHAQIRLEILQPLKPDDAENGKDDDELDESDVIDGEDITVSISL